MSNNPEKREKTYLSKPVPRLYKMINTCTISIRLSGIVCGVKSFLPEYQYSISGNDVYNVPNSTVNTLERSSSQCKFNFKGKSFHIQFHIYQIYTSYISGKYTFSIVIFVENKAGIK